VFAFIGEFLLGSISFSGAVRFRRSVVHGTWSRAIETMNGAADADAADGADAADDDDDDVVGDMLLQVRRRHPIFSDIWHWCSTTDTCSICQAAHSIYKLDPLLPGATSKQIDSSACSLQRAWPVCFTILLTAPATIAQPMGHHTHDTILQMDATMYVMSITINFLNKHSKAEAVAYGWNQVIPSVGSIDAVSDNMQQAMQRTATHARDTGEDLQANLDNSITAAQVEDMLLSGLHTIDPVLRGMKPLAQYQFCAIICKGFLTLNQSDEFSETDVRSHSGPYH
jgi:hypothetical protein